ncbi:E3 ubiquitin-protein ligase XBAT33-like isoform X3 [Carex littledalei]|uniref:O-fucosyltransferase family protein n=1 Tax=Carex littledalei TaxID=544730 RepID=A0A833QQ37_9POAL|nr:E3 ubiquitin-protein ligase XBAT33-like isoform X3 [Carex littledalei]
MGNSLGCSSTGERLVSVARDGDLVEAHMLLELSPSLPRYSTFGGLNSSLHFASAKGHNEIFSLLLDKGAEVNSRNYCGQEKFQVVMTDGYQDVTRNNKNVCFFKRMWRTNSSLLPLKQVATISNFTLEICLQPLLEKLTMIKTAFPKQQNGCIQVFLDGGLNQQRMGICDAIVVAKTLNATLLIPYLEVNSVWQDSRCTLKMHLKEYQILPETPTAEDELKADRKLT